MLIMMTAIMEATPLCIDQGKVILVERGVTTAVIITLLHTGHVMEKGEVAVHILIALDTVHMVIENPIPLDQDIVAVMMRMIQDVQSQVVTQI